MKYNKYILLFSLFLISLITIFIYSNKEYTISNLDIIEVNDVIETLRVDWNNLDASNLPGENYNFDYAILDSNDNYLASTTGNKAISIALAIQNGDTIIYLTESNQVIGKVIFFNNSIDTFYNHRNTLITITVVFIILIFIVTTLYIIYIDNSILKPFAKLESFTKQISLGNLDIPLDMDKHNWFGSFTESFDIMRTELYKVRENEKLANQSKKELVASLSHDIKTPIASIQSVCDLLMLKSENEYELEKLGIINSKVEQINTLITNLFNATLEELQEIKVTVTDESSLILKEIIQTSDYDNKCNISLIPEVLISIDKIRLEQVIDNVISNSYKYANTEIDVDFKLNNGFLEIIFKDYGGGVDEGEIDFLTKKYYRANNAKDKTGTGIGLYITNYFMNKMNGELLISSNNGFIVTLKIPIS